MNGIGIEGISFLKEKCPDRGYGEQRSTLSFYRQGNGSPETGNNANTKELGDRTGPKLC